MVSCREREAMMKDNSSIFSRVYIKAAGQRYKQTEKFVYLGGAISADAKMSIEINRRISAAWARIRKYSSQLYDRPNAELSLKVRSPAVWMRHVDTTL